MRATLRPDHPFLQSHLQWVPFDLNLDPSHTHTDGELWDSMLNLECLHAEAQPVQLLEQRRPGARCPRCRSARRLPGPSMREVARATVQGAAIVQVGCGEGKGL